MYNYLVIRTVNKILDWAIVPLVMCSVIGCAIGAIAGLNYIRSDAMCRALGDKMAITTEYGFWTGCMIEIKGQWLPWSEVVPVDRGGKITFEPKPYVRLGAPETKP
jgi:hypothetical protein